MRIRKCNGCGKILDKNDAFFSLDDITFHRAKGDKDNVRIYFSDELKEKGYDLEESWCSYTDIDFCPECFNKEGLDRFLLKGDK